MIAKALSFGGWPGLVLLFSGLLVGGLYWLYLLYNGDYNKSLFLLIILFPFTFYAGRAFGIVAYYDEFGDFDQRVGLTTLMIGFTWLVLYLHDKIRRPVFSQGKTLEYLLWGFAFSITVSQLFTHKIFSGILLSIGAAWEYVLLFYILISLIRDENSFLNLLNAIFIFSIFNIVVRIVCKGESFIIDLTSQNAGMGSTFGAAAGRVGSGALGPAVSYAGYLAVFITLALGSFFITKRKIYLAYIAIISVELLNTFTRGGIFILFLLGMLLLFVETRKLGYKLIAFIVVLPLLFWHILWEYISLRGFHLNVLAESNFADRLELISKFVYDYYSFSLFGHGILNDTIIELTPWWSTVIHNTYLEILDTCGIFAFVIFILITWYSFYTLINFRQIKLSGSPMLGNLELLRPFFLIAFIQWIVFAITTSTSILEYYPYEGTSIFWILCFSGFIFINIQSNKTSENLKMAND